jgi:Zn-dependent protease
MRWSWKIATVSGIPVRIHATFLLLLVWIFGSHLAGGRSVTQALEGVGLILSIFGCVVLHEFGHALTAKRFGVSTRDITLLPIGGVARLERIPEKPKQEIAIAFAGPAVNLVIASVLLAVLSAQPSGDWSNPATLERNFPARLLVINLVLAIFNMVPAFPMDGGRVLRALLATRLPYVRATQIAANVGQGIALLFGLLGLFGNPMLLFIALFVFIGASQEAAAVQMRSAFDGIPVSRAMVRDFRTLDSREPLSRAVELLLAGHQQDFPIVSGPNQESAGVLVRSDLLTALASGRTDVTVGETGRSCGVAHPSDMLDDAFRRMQESGCPALPVVETGRGIVGMLTLENVGEFAMVQSALGRSRARA